MIRNPLKWYKAHSRLKRIKILSLSCALCTSLGTGIGGYGIFEGYYSRLSATPVHQETYLSEQQLRKENQSGQRDSDADKIISAKDAVLSNLKAQASQLTSDSSVFNILLIGTDQRGNIEGARSDSCILVSLNSASRTITMTSFMRDCYVAIPGYDNNRLNAAYSLGGASLLSQTIEQNFGIDINRYIQVDFSAFIDIVDKLGGIEMEVTEDELYYINLYASQQNGLDAGYEHTPLESAGKIKLNGMEALAFSRIRKIGSDFERTQRQRSVMDAAFKKLRKADIVQLNDMFNAIMPSVSTDLTRGECITLLLDAAQYKNYTVASNRIPRDGAFEDMVIDGMQVLSLDFPANIRSLQQDLYHISSDEEQKEEEDIPLQDEEGNDIDALYEGSVTYEQEE